ncbi:thermoresistant glucokinase carbohydrate kinase [Pseudomonas saudiphocaensis]|uniref:Gluconokinase n=2 Tax=Pseudomonadales TaxID=72274 RepID=A0A078LTH0_9PSED|nr:thermoresistant glucokinase carbohydrate kinase [Pseudomonas saudiphocaensis]
MLPLLATGAEQMIVVVMGVSGSGKTTIGERLAARLECGFSDADQYHGASNKAKMAQGIALTDADREPWLAAMHAAIVERARQGADHVFACSALKRRYRDQLCGNVADVMMVFLHGPAEVLAKRVASRRGHFFDPALLNDQLAVLEPPTADEALAVDIRLTPDEIVERIVQALEARKAENK